MPDFPVTTLGSVTPTTLGTMIEGSMVMDLIMAHNLTTGLASVWPAVNQAIYVAIALQVPVTAYQMSIIVGTTAAGNVDVGIYDVSGNRLVSATPTAIAAAGLQVFNIADTNLTPGTYFLAAWCSTVTTATFNRVNIGNASGERFSGVQIQTGLASGLPATATFANPTSPYVPDVTASIMSSLL